LKKILAIVALLMFLLVPSVFGKCIVSKQRPDPYTTLVFVDIDCNGWVDVVEIWKWNGRMWILVGVRPY